MKAAVVHEAGGPSSLRYEEIADPVVGPRAVLIRVSAASINRGDLARREGNYPGATSYPLILGWEVAGTVEQLGEQVDTVRPGQRVVATMGAGAYADLVAVNRAGVLPIPDRLTFEEAASIPIVFLTAWFALVKLARLQAGETVLIQAGASGVGMAGIQIAKHIGARILTTAGSARKVQWAREFGADHAVDYTTQDFTAEVLNLTERAGVDVVLEQVGGEVLTHSVEVLGGRGRLVTVGNTAREPATLDPGLLMRSGLSLQGLYLGAEMATQSGVRGELQEILDLFAAGKLRTVVDRVFPLAEAASAHAYVGERRNIGKVLLVP